MAVNTVLGTHPCISNCLWVNDLAIFNPSVILVCSVVHCKCNKKQPDVWMALQCLKSPQSLSHTSTQHGHPMVTAIMVMNNQFIFLLFYVNRSSHSWDFTTQTWTLKIQGQGQGYGQRASTNSPQNIQLICFLLISHQSDQQFLWYRYFEKWPWKNPRSRSQVGSRIAVT